MLNSPAAILLSGLALSAVPGAVGAAVLGPQAARCVGDAREPAMLVKIVGLKSRSGVVRVQSYGGDPERFFVKGSYLSRIEVRPPAAGPVEICVPVARSGTYAVSVRHDVNASGKSDRADGGGMSGNPALSLFDVMLRRRPDPAQVAVRVAGVTPVPVVVNYLQGGSFRPITTASR